MNECIDGGVSRYMRGGIQVSGWWTEGIVLWAGRCSSCEQIGKMGGSVGIEWVVGGTGGGIWGTCIG